MKNYDRINALPPDGIERKRAHIIGGGIADFATAAFLIDDAHMPGENIPIYEAAELPGGIQESRIAHVAAALVSRRRFSGVGGVDG